MVTITVNNSISILSGNAKETLKLYNAYGVREPAAFFLRKYMPKGWDGKRHFIRENGKFETGLLSSIVKKAEELEIKVKLDDQRNSKELIAKIPKKLGNKNTRDYQAASLKSIAEHKVMDLLFPRGTLKVATNGGKTLISAGIHKMYKGKTIFLMNSTELFEQALVEMPELLPDVSIGQISPKKIEWGDFMIVKVMTLKNRLKDVLSKLSDYNKLIVDECDLAANKSNKLVIQALYNCNIRLGLSGTVNASKLKKDLIKNMTLESFFGPQLAEITNRELIDKGVSSEVRVKIVKGNQKIIEATGWMDEYTKCIVKNKNRNRRVVKRCVYHWNKGRMNQLVIAQRHEHIIRLLKAFSNAIEEGLLPKEINIDWVHHDRKDRKTVVDNFQTGKVDILVGSMILKRGKNFPKMKYMINAGAGKSPENILQLLGRAFRGCKRYEDFFDEGRYLKSHSRKRVIYYKNEKIEVIKKFS